MPYEIKLSQKDLPENGMLEVWYENHDDHTFWYKFNVEESEKLSFSFAALDGQKGYDLYFYQYDGANFCRSMIQNNLELLSFESNVRMKLNKGSSYYLGIHPLGKGGCGHALDISFGNTEFRIESKDVNRSCKKAKVAETGGAQSENEALVTIRGKVIDAKTGRAIHANLIFTDPFLGFSNEAASGIEKGFEVALQPKGDYQVTIKAFGYKPLVSAMTAFADESPVFKLLPSGDANFVLDNVYFYPNTYALKEESENELESVFSFLRNNPGYIIRIIGHTNGNKDIRAGKMVSESGPEWNFNGTAQELSLRRAEIIKNFLVKKGISADQLKTEGKGGAEMIIVNPTSMTEAMKNIRVEIRIVGKN